MPTWLIMLLVKFALRAGLPALEKRFPRLAPIIEEILKVIGGGLPSQALHSAADHYEKVCTGAICPTELVHE